MNEPRFAIGIDLGTTHTALSSSSLSSDEPPSIFAIPQVTQPHEVAAQPLLPSFVYLPQQSELAPGATALPWAQDRAFCVGALARDKSASVPGRVVASAKSWLSHSGVDRRAAILPHGATADSDVERLSPIEVQTRLLRHLVEAWQHSHADAPLDEQEIVLTVPASFDAVARALTEEAARGAGIDNATLLEEPQAALYAWLAMKGDGWRKDMKPGDQILVVDIGGGTTDFSLIAVEDDGAGNLQLVRKAVGDHILLGGDNMDLALAFTVKQRLEAEGKSIDDWQLRALTHSCRVAKEALLEDTSRTSHGVVIPGRGSKLIGGTLRAEIARSDLDAVLLEGFFPRVDRSARPLEKRRSALMTLGLPYAHDAGITRHLAAFLDGQAPTALLFNGGVMRSAVLRARIVEILNGWLHDAGAPPATVLPGADPDFAVARGAAAYARVRRGKGLRIKGGTARAYYVGIERAELAVPGIPPRVDAVCIAPKGMEEGTAVTLPRELGLVVGEPATFRFFASSTRQDALAVIVEVTPQAGLTEIAPIETILPAEASGARAAVVPARLEARVSEVGTLELAAVEVASARRHRLEFSVRGEEPLG